MTRVLGSKSNSPRFNHISDRGDLSLAQHIKVSMTYAGRSFCQNGGWSTPAGKAEREQKSSMLYIAKLKYKLIHFETKP